jgi:hypothetical protein
MFLVKLLWETDGQLHSIVDVHPHLPCVAQVMVDVTSQLEHLHEGQVMARLLLVVRSQDAHLVLCCYEAPHLLGGEVPTTQPSAPHA